MGNQDKDRAIYNKERNRRLKFKNFAAGPVMQWLDRNVDLRYDSLEAGVVEGPAIIAVNHASVYDFLFVSAAALDRDMSYVISEHVMRVKPWGPLLARYASLIPHRKGARGSRTAVKILERLALGESVYLAVEGEQTWNGITMDIKPGCGKLAKKSGAALITYRIEGSYLLRPRWAGNLRRGTVNCKCVNVYTPEMLAGMSAEEIDEAIAHDLYFDIWKWQEDKKNKPCRYKCPGGAGVEGITKALCSCPKCSSIGWLSEKGEEIVCRCGFKTRFKQSGFFDTKDGPATIPEWEETDRRAISAAIEAARDKGDEVFADHDVTLYRLGSSHDEEELSEGRIALAWDGDRLVIRTAAKSFDLADIYEMTMVQAGRLLFSIDKEYYEIRSKKVNLRKYMQAKEIYIGLLSK